jgi:hypothetical protein
MHPSFIKMDSGVRTSIRRQQSDFINLIPFKMSQVGYKLILHAYWTQDPINTFPENTDSLASTNKVCLVTRLSKPFRLLSLVRVKVK